MTYRNKLLLKRIAIILAIVLAALLLLGILVFTYLGRYVVYTEDGAHFSFHSEAQDTLPSAAPGPGPSQVELVIGSSISAGEVLGDGETSIVDKDVKGLLLDYNTLADGSSLNEVDLSADTINTLALEMRTQGSQILNTEPVLQLIQRAESQEIRLIAVISCLDDLNYVQQHRSEGIFVYGNSLWTDDNGNPWMDPTQESVITYLAGIIRQLSEMGFDEVVLKNFEISTSERIDFDAGDSTRGELVLRAYNDLVDATINDCDLGLLIEDPDSGHQAMDAADRIYVCFSEGSLLKEYAEAHPDHYLVFITGSHDTRFDNYGKLTCESELGQAPTGAEVPAEDTGDVRTDGEDLPEETPGEP